MAQSYRDALIGLGIPAQAAKEMGDNNEVILNTNITLASAGQRYVVSPIAGDVQAVYSVLSGALTTGDETLTVKDGDGNSMGTITLTQSGSAAGDIDSLTSVSNATVAAGEAIEVETDGANGTASIADISILVRRS